MNGSTAQIVAAVIVTIPATVAAIYAILTKRHVDTGNGKKLAQYVVEARDVLDAVDKTVNDVQSDIKSPSGDSIATVTDRNSADLGKLLDARSKADV